MKQILLIFGLMLSAWGWGQKVIKINNQYINNLQSWAVINLGKRNVEAENNYYAFQSDIFNFVTNQLIDKSGNNNHATLVNASARTGNAKTYPGLESLLTGLINYYTFDESSGSLLDIIGSIDGTSEDMPTRSSVGKVGTSYYFNNDIVDLSSAIVFSTSTSFSVSCWINTKSVAAGNKVVIGTSTSTNQYIYLNRTDDDMNFSIQGDNGVGGSLAKYSNILTADNWFHVVGIRNIATDSIYIYVNGIKGAQTLDATTSQINPVIRIGDIYTRTGVYAFNGNIDEIGIWNKALSKAEVDSLYKSTTPFSGNGLFYEIPDILISDIITVELGSDIPTIPINGILKIAKDSMIYGVTVTRNSSTWAVIPLCEPQVCNENLPKVSYDVSGNGHHATARELATANITTQDNYFYLQQNGYTLGGPELLANRWNFNSWTGTFPDEIWSGLDYNGGHDTSSYVSNGGNGRAILRRPYQVREYNVYTIGKRYINKVNVDSLVIKSGTKIQTGFDATTSGLMHTSYTTPNTNRVINRIGLHRSDNIAVYTYFDFSHTGFTNFYRAWVDSVSVREKLIVPALLTGLTDALGRTLENPANDTTWLEYACDLSFPTSTNLKTADQKGCWSDLIMSGVLINGKTYLIESTEVNHFGVGKIIHNEFVSNGIEWANRNNTVRELILNDTNRGLFFTDAGVANDISYSEIKQRRPHFQYAYKPYSIDANEFHYDNGIISKLNIMKSNFYVTTPQNLQFITDYSFQQEVNIVPIFISFDASAGVIFDSINKIFSDRHLNYTAMINYAGTWTKIQAQALMTLGNEIGIHSAWDWNIPGFIPEYKGFAEDQTNYNAAQLITYYDSAKLYYQQQLGITINNHSFPGGTTDTMTRRLTSYKFRSGRLASGSGNVTRIPISSDLNTLDGMLYNFWGFPAQSLDVIGASDANLATDEGYIDTAILYKNALCFYGHPATEWDAADWIHFKELLAYLVTLQQAGSMVRIYTINDALDIIEQKK